MHPASYVTDILTDALIGVSGTGGPSSAPAARLVEQLVRTDWFIASVLSSASSPTTVASIPDQRRAEIADVQRRLTVAADGIDLVGVRYSTEDPARGIGFVNALLEKLGDAFVDLESERAAAAAKVAAAAQPAARDEMQRAVAEAHSYADTISGDGGTPAQDPVFVRLSATARAATAHFERLSALADTSRLAGAAAPELRRQAAFVADRPVVEPEKRFRAAVRAALLGATAVAVLELLLVYLIALHDPRLRSLDDLRAFIEGPCVISVPSAGRPTDPA
jgi:hypothetical protein